jgi:hypothetical protein
LERRRANAAAARASIAANGCPERQRSALTNGSRLFANVDGRNPWVRRAKDVIGALLADLGGEDNTTTAERSIIRRCAVLTCELEVIEARFAEANGASSEDLDLYQRTANSLRRLLEAIGLERRSRDVTPTLSTYLDLSRPSPGSPGGDGAVSEPEGHPEASRLNGRTSGHPGGKAVRSGAEEAIS